MVVPRSGLGGNGGSASRVIGTIADTFGSWRWHAVKNTTPMGMRKKEIASLLDGAVLDIDNPQEKGNREEGHQSLPLREKTK